jgi:hypothetical protein
VTVDPGAIRYRAATALDAEAVASLHPDSWRRHYRGAYLDSYLDGPVLADRRIVWTGRLAEHGADHHTIIAERDGDIVGFAHTILNDDPQWGALLENLHVRYDVKRTGIGTGLLTETARLVIEASPLTGLYLWVLEQNQPAQAFYQAQGAQCAGQRWGGPFPGGGTAVTLRYAWSDPATLAHDV